VSEYFVANTYSKLRFCRQSKKAHGKIILCRDSHMANFDLATLGSSNSSSRETNHHRFCRETATRLTTNIFLLRAHLLAVSFLVVVGKMRATVGKKKTHGKNSGYRWQQQDEDMSGSSKLTFIWCTKDICGDDLFHLKNCYCCLTRQDQPSLVEREALVRAFSPGSTLEPGLKVFRRRGPKCWLETPPFSPGWYNQP
jgi:hypothetical protein